MVAPFAGVFYPVSTLPIWMRAIARLLPPSAVFEDMRRIVLRQPISVAELYWGAALAIVYLVLACWFFARVHRRAIRTGLIARYSAENLG